LINPARFAEAGKLNFDFDTVVHQANRPTRTGSSDAQQGLIIGFCPGMVNINDLIGIENEIAPSRGHTLARTHAFLLIDNNVIT
jgi:hypothetical protein